MSNAYTRRAFLRFAVLGASGALLAACKPQIVEVTKIVKETVVQEKEKVVKETVQVEKQVEVQKEVTRVVEKQVAAPKSKIVLRLAKASHPSRACFDRAAKQYMEANPNITVTVEDTPYDELFTKGLAMGATGLMWDVFEGHNIWKPYLSWKGICLQLDEFIEANDIQFSDFFPSVIADCRLWTENKLKWLPTFVHPAGNAMVAWNVNMLKEAGVNPPPTDGNWTIDDWEGIIRKVAKPPEVFGTEIVISHSLYTQQYCRTWGLPTGGPGAAGSSEDSWLLSADGKKQQLGEEFPRVKKSLEWYYNLAKDGYIPTDAQRQLFPGVDLFTAGKEVSAACMVAGPEWQREAIGDKFEALYVPWPKGPDGSRGSCLSYNTMSAFTKTQYPYESFMLLAHLTGPDAALWAGTEGQSQCMARESAWFSPKLWSRPASGKAMEFAAHWFKSGIDPFPQPWNLRFVEWQEAFDQHTSNYRNAKETWNEMLGHCQPECQKIIDLPRA